MINFDVISNGVCLCTKYFCWRTSETEDGYTFIYNNEYLKKAGATAVSLTLPMTSEIYSSKTLFSFFDGLIPEGWMLDIVSRNWKIDTKDRFGILLLVCKDVIGNVSIRENQI